MNYYRQCKLSKKDRKYSNYPRANSYDVVEIFLTSWIPEQFAYIGNYIKVLNKDSLQWEDGWQVVEIGIRAPEDEVLERNQDYKHQRKASDI